MAPRDHTAWCMLALLVVADAAPFSSPDLVTDLPGAPAVSFDTYSGYVEVVDDSDNEPRFLHYWFTTAVNNPETAPVLLWLNGGPGCSSMMGLLTENGPFEVASAEPPRLELHKHAWNADANVIYLDAPAPVGFSYGGNGTSGDNMTAHDNYHFLLGFMDKFPELADRELYITGESYAGQYIPQLAYRILEGNSNSSQKQLNLKGFMVGNPSGLSSSEWEVSYWEFMARHGFLSENEVDSVAQACNYTEHNTSPNCTSLQLKLFNQNFKGVDPYNILAPCLGDGPGLNPGCFTQRMLGHGAPPSSDAMTREILGMQSRLDLGQTFVPCTTFNKTQAYLRRDDVKAALHISEKAYDWTPCSEHLNYTQYQPGTPDLYRLMAGKIRIMVYSGDVDSCVPFVGTRRGVELLGLPEKEPYRQWKIYDETPGVESEQIAGYVHEYEGVTFCTVRGSGHMVPHDRPQQALAMLNSFLSGKPL